MAVGYLSVLEDEVEIRNLATVSPGLPWFYDPHTTGQILPGT